MANTKITSRVIADDAILTANIADDQITSALIADDVALGGNPTTSTQTAGNNTTRIATTAFVSTAVANIVNSAPSTLDTLGEIATALNNDAALNTTLTNSIAAKLPLAGGTMTGNIVMGDDTSIGIADDAERIEFDGAGDISFLGANVGINDNTPAARFTVKAADNTYAGGLRIEGTDETTALAITHVNGDNFISGNATDDHITLKGNGIVHIGSGTAINDANVKLQLNAPSSGEAYLGVNDNGAYALLVGYASGNYARIRNIKNTPILFETNNDEKMRIDASGNVGIGVVPSTWPSNGDFVGLQVGSGLSLYGRGSGDQDRAGMTANAYVDTNNDRFEYIASGHATHFAHSDGNFIFFTAPSGSANGEITYTERLRIENGGTIGIGGDLSAKTLSAGRSDAGTLIQANSASSAGSGIINFMSSLTSSSNNANCTHYQGTTQGVASYKLLGNGSSTWSSDINLKRDIITTRDGYLDDIKKLRVVKYKWKNDSKSALELGLIAQEVEAIFPKLITEDKNSIGDEVLYTEKDEIPTGKTVGDVKVEGTTYKGIKYGVIPLILLKGMQEQQTIIEDLKARIETLEG